MNYTLNMRSAVMLLLALAAGIAPAHWSSQQKVPSQNTCTDADAQRALSRADRLKSWYALSRSFKLYAACDDGAIAEGYSDTVGRLLAHDWKHFAALSRLVRSDIAFQRFVLGHIDETLPDDVLITIAENAKRHCPSGDALLCNKIADQATAGNSASSPKR